MAADEVVVYLVGGVGPNRPDPDSMFAQVAPMLQLGHIGFCQSEENLSIRSTPLPQARLPMRSVHSKIGFHERT